MTDQRRILLVDCDMFFVQVARLADPEGAGKAALLIVGGSGEGRGVVTSADYRVREYGVHSAMPTAHALRLCPEATVVPVPREACGEASRRIRRVLGTLAPVVQAASIDEFYLDLTGTERLFHSEPLEVTARKIRERVLEDTRISVSIGGGTARLVAKLAAERAKPGGVRVVAPGEEEAFLQGFELSDLPGVGPRFLEELERRGLRSVEEALAVEEAWLTRWLGPARGRWLWERIRGIDPTPVVAEEERRSISSERTFPRDITDQQELERHLLQLALSVGESLRAKGFRGRTVTVKVRDRDFTTRQASRTLPQGVESDQAVYGTARDLLAELRTRRRGPVRLLGVGISNLEGEDRPEQLGLFEPRDSEESERDRTLSRLGDRVRERFGPDALLPGGLLEAPSPDHQDPTDEEER